MRAFKGVASRYLPSYLGGRRSIERSVTTEGCDRLHHFPLVTDQKDVGLIAWTLN